MGIPLPDGYHSVNAYIVVDGAERLIEFLGAAFGGVVHENLPAPDGSVGHAEVRIGDSLVMLTDPTPDHPARPCTHYVYVDDVDLTYRRALEAGATSVVEPADMFYGDRSGGVVDPTGNMWWLATHLEDVSPEEIRRRSQER